MSIAALLVTHNAEDWIEETLTSVFEQSQSPDIIVIVDDHSSDQTISIIRRINDARIQLHKSITATRDVTTRIARNFQQGVAVCFGYDYIVLGDQDDVWRTNRIAHQIELLERNVSAAMVASDGQLMDADGDLATLRTVFPVPQEWSSWSGSERMRCALQCSIATGGASALRVAGMDWSFVPRGWLHDRWWSLSATAQQRMLLDDEVVLDYRISPEQHTGLAHGMQQMNSMQRMTHGLIHLPTMARRLRDLHQLRNVTDDPDIKQVFAWSSLLRVKVLGR